MTETQNKSKGMHITLWVLQVLLGGMFIMAGAMKVMTPIDELALKAPWVADMPGLAKFIGMSELLGGLGLILPALLRKWTILTPLAAIGIFLIMFLAVIFHIRMGETATVGMPILLGLIAFFIAWGRFKAAPIANK